MPFILLVCMVLLGGCGKKQQFEPKPVCLAGTDIDFAMRQTEKALLKMNFVVEKADAESGLMRTRPLSSGQFFEFWRKDNRNSYSRSMANLHTLQRTAELSFDRKNGQLCIDCRVKVERLSIPEEEIDSSAKAYCMFSESSESTQTLILGKDQEKDMAWINLGRDNGLESYILEKINKQIIKAKGKK